MFLDSAKIFIQSGKGGNGCVSFLREKYRPNGGPDGGDGGKGGDIVFVTDPRLNTLIDFRYHQHYRANNGSHGKGKNRAGKSAKDLLINIPLGTLIYDDDNNTVLADMDKVDSKVILARGGRGGKGNAHFASSTYQSPRFSQEGEAGQERWIRLELKLLADVGVIGFPNAGKSTFISRVSAARPKIADFPFTTLVPNLGIVHFRDFRNLCFADIPGIIEGAHLGKGLGLKFLKHVERTNLLLHFIDPVAPGNRSPFSDYKMLNNELAAYLSLLKKKPQFVVFNKIDVTEARDNISELKIHLTKANIAFFEISSISGEGIQSLLNEIDKFFQ